MFDSPPVRIGIVRPAPVASDHRVAGIVAEIEARVLAHELARRLGPVLLDLRIGGDALGRWQPLAHASWPAAIDARVDAGGLWSASTPLTALFARTVQPAAAEVRARMLAHLGMIPAEPAPLDAARLADLAGLCVRATDLWLLTRAATVVETGVAEIDALATPPTAPGIAQLDATFDALCAAVPLPSAATMQHMHDEVAALRARVAELEADAQRTAVESAVRIDDLMHERAVLRERLTRAELDGVDGGPAVTAAPA